MKLFSGLVVAAALVSAMSSVSAFANLDSVSTGADAEAIYNALNVPAQRGPHVGVGVDVTEKQVGGLSCIRESVPHYGADFKCTLDNAFNSEVIYNALDVKAKNLTPGLLGVVNLSKTAGDLTCLSHQIPGSHPHYSCKKTEN